MAGIFDIGGGKSAKFDNQGDRVQGIVESFKVSQQNKFDSVNWKPTNDPDFWPSGDPKMQVVIAVDTTQGGTVAGIRENSEDDGVRNVYATITSGEGTMFRAIQDAIKAAHGGVKADIEQGAFLDVWFSGYDPNSKNKQNPKKVYGAAYRRPATPFTQAGPADQGDQGNPWNPAPTAAAPAQQFQQAPAGNFQPQGHGPAAQFAPQGGYVQQGAPAGPPPQQFQQPQAAPQQQPQAWEQQYDSRHGGQPQAPQYDQGGAPQYGGGSMAMPTPPAHTGGPMQVPGQQGIDFGAQQQPQAAPGWAQQAPAGPGPFQQGGGIDFAAMAAQQAPQQFGQAPGQDDPARAQQVAQAQAHFPNAPQQQAPAPAPAQQVVNVDMQRVQALLAAQMDDATIMQATGITLEALNLAKNLGAVPAGMPQ